MKKKGYDGHTGLGGEENPAKNLVENEKKIEDGACLNRREKKDFEKVI